jgi:hypothetical protein
MGDFSNENWRDPAFWRELAPDLTVEGTTGMRNPGGWQPSDMAPHLAKLRKEGYLQFPPIDWPRPVEALARGVARLSEAGIPPVFCYVYDEFWDLFAHIAPLLGSALGGDYRVIPNLWAWHIDPKHSESGWAPHRDLGRWSLLPDGAPKSLSVWIPLTDATPLNGCMYLVPADRDPTYNTPAEYDVQVNLQEIRALPAAAGSVLCWNQALLHWGAHAAEGDLPVRISVSFEFQRGDVQAINVPLLDPLQIPDFTMRLRVISKGLLHYCEKQALPPGPIAFALSVVRGWPLWMMSPEAAKWTVSSPAAG